MRKIAKKRGHGLLTKAMTVFLIAVMTLCMVPGLGMMSGMSEAYAAEPGHISGNVNISDMIENTDYVLDGDTVLYIDADLDIFSIDMDSYDLTITGDGTHTLNVQGIRGTVSVMEMQSGILEMNFGSNEAPYAAIDLGGELKMTGGKMDLAYTCMSDSANTVYGIHVDQFTMTGGDLNVYALVDEAASCRGIEFSDGFTMTGGTAKFVGETFENNRAGFGVCGSGIADFSITGGKLTAEGYTSGNEAYGIAVYNDKTQNTNVFGGGTVRANGSRNGIFCWAPVIIKDGVQLYANTEQGCAIETDGAEIDISGEGTYVLAETGSESTSAIHAFSSDLSIDSDTLKIVTPPGGYVSGYYIVDSEGQKAPKVEITDANTYKLTAVCWDTRDNCAITEGVSVILNSDSHLGSNSWMVPGGSSFILGIDNNSGGTYVFQGWAKGSTDGTVIGGGSETISQNMPAEDVTYYALFDNTADIVIHSLTFTAYTEPTAGELSVKPLVTAAEEGVTVDLIRWLDSSQSNIGFNHEFVAGETVCLVFRFNVAEGYTLASDIGEHITVNGEAPDDLALPIRSMMKAFVVGTGTEYIPNSFNITYDESKAFPTTRLTGHEVSLHLLRSVTSNPGDSLDGRGWLVYDADPNKTGYAASRWTSLVKRDGNRYVALYDSDELLNTEDEYYFCFNIEDKDEDDILPFDMSRPFYITVNGEPADEVQASGESNGDLYVYKRVEINETDDLVWNVIVTPENAKVKQGMSRQFTAEVYGATNDSVVWTVSENSSTGTYIDSDGELFVSPEEELDYVYVTAASAVDNSISDTERVLIVDYLPTIDSVTVTADRPVVCRGTGADFSAVVEGTDIHDLTWELLGSDGSSYFNSGSNTSRYLLVGSEETSESLTVRATSVADPSKFGEATIQLKDKELITGPINITFDESKVSLVDDLGSARTGKQVTQAFREAITSPYGDNLNEEDAPDGWFVYGEVSSEPHYEYTALVYKTGEDSYKSLYDSDESLDKDREYFLWFNIEDTYLTRYFDHSLDLEDLNITVNGRPINGTTRLAKWGGDIEVYVRITFDCIDPSIFSVTLDADNYHPYKGDAVELTAGIEGNLSHELTWELSGKTSEGTGLLGDSNLERTLTIGEDEGAGPITVKVTSAADHAYTAEVYIYPEDKPAGPAITSVKLTADNEEPYKGSMAALTAEVGGDAPHDLTWEFTGNTSTGTKWADTGDFLRHLMIAEDEASSAITVKVTSTFDPSKTAEVVLKPQDKPVELAITSVTLKADNETPDKGGTVTLTAAVEGTAPHDLKWELKNASSTGTAFNDTDNLVRKLTIGTDEASSAITVKVTSTFDPSKTAEVTIKPKEDAPAGVEIERLAGPNRYQTAFEAADRLKKELGTDKFENIVIASGLDFPDALAGAYLAKVKNAPILLTNAGMAPTVAEYVKNNMASGGTVYILGGTGAVPEVMETALEGQKVERLAGSNRYMTNIEILKAAGVAGEDILVCDGKGYADSLSASAVGKPILLVNGNALLPAQKEYLEEIKGSISGSFYAIGGTGAVSDAVFNEVKTYASGATDRVAGLNRYTTSVEVAKKFFPASVDRIVLAYARNYPDGLAGGPVAYSLNAPLLLVTDSAFVDAQEYTAAAGAKKATIMGGEALISDATAYSILGE